MKDFDVEAAKAARRQRIVDRDKNTTPSSIPASTFSEGDESQCPVCKGTMIFIRGLSHVGRVQTGLLVVANVAAFVCNQCGERSYDAPSMGIIQSSLNRQSSGMAIGVKLSKLARSNIGVYLPQDIQRHLRVEAGDRLMLQPVGHDFLVVEVERQTHKNPRVAPTRRFVVATETFETHGQEASFTGWEVTEGDEIPDGAVTVPEERLSIERADRRHTQPPEIRTDSDVPADSPTARMKLTYGPVKR